PAEHRRHLRKQIDDALAWRLEVGAALSAIEARDATEYERRWEIQMAKEAIEAAEYDRVMGGVANGDKEGEALAEKKCREALKARADYQALVRELHQGKDSTPLRDRLKLKQTLKTAKELLKEARDDYRTWLIYECAVRTERISQRKLATVCKSCGGTLRHNL